MVWAQVKLIVHLPRAFLRMKFGMMAVWTIRVMLMVCDPSVVVHTLVHRYTHLQDIFLCPFLLWLFVSFALLLCRGKRTKCLQIDPSTLGLHCHPHILTADM